MYPAAWASASGRSPSACATRPASASPSPGTRFTRIAADSARASTSTSTGTATSAQSWAREVISTCPAPLGSASATSSGPAALSKTSSHRSRCRSSASTAPRAAASPAPGSAQPSSPASAASCSPISPAASALTHHTRSYPPANRCAYSIASCVLPTPPMPYSACTTALSPDSSASRTETSRPSRPVNPGLRAGTFHTRGLLPGLRGPVPPARLRLPGNPGLLPGRTGPAAASSSARRAASSSTPNTSRVISGRSTGGTLSAGTASTRTGTSRSAATPGTCTSVADHSSVVYRSGSKYAAENSATTRSARPSAPLIAVTKFRPAAQSHTSSSTQYPASVSCQATHSAHARSAPA